MNTLDLATLTLDRGSHCGPAPEGGACMLEVVSWLADEPWSFRPQCVSPVISAFCVALNDCLDEVARNRILKPYIERIIGTNTGQDDDIARMLMAAGWAVRKAAPNALRQEGRDSDAAILEGLPTALDPNAAMEAAECAAGLTGSAAAYAARAVEFVARYSDDNDPECMVETAQDAARCGAVAVEVAAKYGAEYTEIDGLICGLLDEMITPAR